MYRNIRKSPRARTLGGRVTAGHDIPASPRLPLWYWLLIPAVFMLYQFLVETQRVPPLAAWLPRVCAGLLQV